MDEHPERRKSDEKIAVLEERVRNWMESTTDYRTQLCRKLDKIMDRLGNLPCDKRAHFYDSLDRQIKAIWVLVVAVILAMVARVFAGGL